MRRFGSVQKSRRGASARGDFLLPRHFLFPRHLAWLVVTVTMTATAIPQETARPGETARAAEAAVADTTLEIPATDEGLPGEGPIRRYDWFRQLWKQRRGEWANRAGQDRGAVVFLGDSITQGWGDRLATAFAPMKVANRGISGDTTRGMLIRLGQDVLTLDPAGVVMLMGTNDLEEGASPEQIVGNVGLILRRIRDDSPEVPIVICEVFPSSPEKSRPPEAIREVNRRLAALVAGETGVILLDTWTLFADESGNARAGEFPDRLHPNDVGYEKWAGALRPLLEAEGLLPFEPEHFEPEAGFELLFHGHDLTGWGYRPADEKTLALRERVLKTWEQPPTWPLVEQAVSFDGQVASDDGRYLARGGRLIVRTPREGRRIQTLWTTREFPEDFTLRLEFRATPNADSGVFLRAPQLQCRDFLLAGPYKNLRRYRPADWNEIEVRVRGNQAHASCNGEVLEEAMRLPDSGPIGLEGDRGQMEYRRIRIRID